FIWVSRILREIGRAGGCGRAIDRRQQHQIASRIIDLPSAERQNVQGVVKPQTVVEHESEEALLRPLLTVGEAAHTGVIRYAAAMFASRITGQRECGL